jgi:signal transduction histidine kinase
LSDRAAMWSLYYAASAGEPTICCDEEKAVYLIVYWSAFAGENPMNDNRQARFFSAVLNRSLLGFTLFALPALLASVLRSRDTGWLPLYSLQLVEAAILIVTYALRDRISYRPRLMIFLSVIYLIGMQGALFFNVTFAWVTAAVLCVLLITIFGGSRYGAALALLTVALLSLLGLATVRNWLTFPDQNFVIHLPSSWVTLVFGFLLFSFVGIFALGTLREYFLTSLEEAHKAEADIRQINADLEQRVRQRTAQLEVTNRELEAFAYSVSHELRTPLRAISGYNKLIGQEYAACLETDGTGYVEQIRAATQEMDELIEALLTLSRVTARGIEMQPVDLSGIAEGVLRELTRTDPGRSVEWEIEPGLVAHADYRLMYAALRNLLENAWKFSSHKEVAHISFGRRQSGRRTAYYVQDNGIGFSPEQAENLFVAFERLSDGEEYAGLGIGLATVQRIVHRHGGRIWAEAVPHQGATFYFTFPEPGA